MAPWIRKLKAARPAMLSPAALETVAVVAYRQPLVKSEIDRIRGVDVSGALKGLLEKKLVRIVGRKDVPGKPIIYGTTKRFLEVFNLKDLSELPTLRDLKDLQGDETFGELSGLPMSQDGRTQQPEDGPADLFGIAPPQDETSPQGDDTFTELAESPTPRDGKAPQHDKSRANLSGR